MNANVKSRQFCSVCKQWLDMEVYPTNEGEDDDGVIWFRCPQCQGFLPKLSGADLKSDPEPEAKTVLPADESSQESAESEPGAESSMRWDSPADMMAEMAAKDGPEQDESAAPVDDDPLLGAEEAVALPDLDDLDKLVGDDLADEVKEATPENKKVKDDPPVPEPIMEYAALLAATDVSEAIPYRHWGTYEVGQCIHHLAWNDCGVVVAKEELPGGRLVIKVYFEEAGVVRLIEQAPR